MANRPLQIGIPVFMEGCYGHGVQRDRQVLLDQATPVPRTPALPSAVLMYGCEQRGAFVHVPGAGGLVGVISPATEPDSIGSAPSPLPVGRVGVVVPLVEPKQLRHRRQGR